MASLTLSPLFGQRTAFGVTLFLLLLPWYAQGTTLRVAHTPPYDFNTITAALNAAPAGTTLLIADGNYSATTGERYPLRLKQGVSVRREDPASLPHILGDGNSTVVYAQGFRDFNTVLEGLDIRFGGGLSQYEHKDGGGMFCRDVNLTVRFCTFRLCSADRGGGVASWRGNIRFTGCTFQYLNADLYGGAFYFIESSSVFLDCVFHNNHVIHPWEPIGGGGYFEMGTHHFEGCEITNNSAALGGGGLWFTGGTVLLKNCHFSMNQGQAGAGASCNHRCQALVTKCTFIENDGGPTGRGGALAIRDGSIATIENCQFINNRGDYGGAVHFSLCGDTPRMENCLFLNNYAFMAGGALYAWTSSLSLSRCQFFHNWNQWDGGGAVYLYQGVQSFTNCVFWDNHTATNGGAIVSTWGWPSFTNCTLIGNYATNGGALYGHQSYPTFTNSILWHDLPQEVQMASGAPAYYHCNLEGGCPESVPCENVIAQDPRLVDLAGGDVHLLPDSLCINAGTASGTPDTDFEGEARPDPETGLPDIGADEFYPAPATTTPTPSETPIPTATPSATPFPTNIPSSTPIPTETSTPTGTPPPSRLLAAGYLDTALNSAGGTLNLWAVGQGFLTGEIVEIYWQGAPAGVPLAGDGEVFSLTLPLPAGLPTGRFLLELGSGGRILFPYLQVGP